MSTEDFPDPFRTYMKNGWARCEACYCQRPLSKLQRVVRDDVAADEYGTPKTKLVCRPDNDKDDFCKRVQVERAAGLLPPGPKGAL